MKSHPRTWHPGQKVICTDDSFSSASVEKCKRFPLKGEIYTIRSIQVGLNPPPDCLWAGFLLEEIVNPKMEKESECGFWECRFEPFSGEQKITNSSGKLMILTGKGLSESSVPNFGHDSKLWKDDMFSEHTSKDDYNLMHQFYSRLRTKLGAAQPNAAHRQIAQWEAAYRTTVITQTVDDLLERGGCKGVTHLNGFLTEMRCDACLTRWSIGYTEWKETDHCPKARCQSHERVLPTVVSFANWGPVDTLLYQSLEDLHPEDVLLVIGSSGVALPIDSIAGRAKCTKILNNFGEGDAITAENFDHVFREPPTQAISKIDEVLKKVLGNCRS